MPGTEHRHCAAHRDHRRVDRGNQLLAIQRTIITDSRPTTFFSLAVSPPSARRSCLNSSGSPIVCTSGTKQRINTHQATGVRRIVIGIPRPIHCRKETPHLAELLDLEEREDVDRAARRCRHAADEGGERDADHECLAERRVPGHGVDPHEQRQRHAHPDSRGRHVRHDRRDRRRAHHETRAPRAAVLADRIRSATAKRRARPLSTTTCAMQNMASTKKNTGVMKPAIAALGGAICMSAWSTITSSEVTAIGMPSVTQRIMATTKTPARFLPLGSCLPAWGAAA